MNITKKIGRTLFPVAVSLLYFFLYVPILVLVFFSFNTDPYAFAWKGFTIKWYIRLFKSVEIWHALQNSLIVAVVSATLSVSLGMLFVVYMKRKYLAQTQLFFYGILAIPEVVLAVSMLSLFYFMNVPFGFTTLIAGHTLLGLGYVIPIVYTQFSSLDRRVIEAAYDLGATREQVLRTIIVPLLRPALLSGGLLAFVISLDDFVFSFFCSGASAQTLPIYIFAMIKTGASPVIAVLSTFLLMVSSMMIFVVVFVQAKKLHMVQQ